MEKQEKCIVSVQITAETKSHLQVIAFRLNLSLSEVMRLKLESNDQELVRLKKDNIELQKQLKLAQVWHEKQEFKMGNAPKQTIQTLKLPSMHLKPTLNK
jgi:antitoxin component of RelBE/YafQ-DinJ toxin-antitoxin module